MELKLKGFDGWCIDTAHNGRTRWADVYQKVNGEWEQFAGFIGEDSLGEALDCLINDGLRMTEDEVNDQQEDVYDATYDTAFPKWREFALIGWGRP